MLPVRMHGIKIVCEDGYKDIACEDRYKNIVCEDGYKVCEDGYKDIVCEDVYKDIVCEDGPDDRCRAVQSQTRIQTSMLFVSFLRADNEYFVFL